MTQKLSDWKAMKAWLEQNFGRVQTVWQGPGAFVSGIEGLNISNGKELTLGFNLGKGKTGPQSIRALFDRIAATPENGEYLVLRGIGPATLDPRTRALMILKK
jgi:hypothetical protein